MGWWGSFFSRIRKALMPITRPISFALEWGARKLTDYAKRVIAYAQEHPWKFAITVVVVGVGIALIVTPLALGFAGAGVVAGSTAAVIQASIGNVVAGSLFAVMQSLTMTGTLSAVGAAMVASGAVSLGAMGLKGGKGEKIAD